MRFKERQARLERKVYESINDLEEEFGIEVDQYPEVRWLGRLGKFEDLALSEQYRYSVESNQKAGGSVFLYKPNVIVINKDKDHHINEEAAHCFHLRTAKLSLSDKTAQDWYSVNVLIEMLGYLGSKILNPSRENIYAEYPDYLAMALNRRVGIQDALGPLRDLDQDILSEFLIHSQGYGLGERMFYAMESGNTSNEQVTKLFKKKFKRKGEATKTLIDLRSRMWPIGKTE